MGRKSPWPLLALFSLLVLPGLSQDLDLSDALDDASTEQPPVPTSATERDPFGLDEKATAKPPGGVTTTTKAPAKPKPKPASDELDLTDALDPSNDIRGKDKKKGEGDQFTDDDLTDIEGYSPDKGKGGFRDSSDSDDNYDSVPETATIAGIVSAVAMALVGAVSSYISYQKKKLCFSIQQSLNAEVTKGENPEAVVSQEPQAQQTLLQPSSAEPPQE